MGDLRFDESGKRNWQHDDAANHQHINDRAEQTKQEVAEMPDAMEDCVQNSCCQSGNHTNDIA